MTTSSRSASVRAAQGPERSIRRDLVHLVILVVPWALFGWLWWRVVATTSVEQLLSAGGLVLLVVVICVPATLLWVLHNVRIFRRKGPRTGTAVAPFTYRTDWTSRPVEADWATVRAAHLVVVDLTPQRKRFVADELTVYDQLLTSHPAGAGPASQGSSETRDPGGGDAPRETDDPREPAAARIGP